MKNLKQGFVISIIIGIVALLVIGVGAYIYTNEKAEAPVVIDPNLPAQGKESFSSQDEQTQARERALVASSELLDWKTYTNTQYGYEFQYPNNFVLKNGETQFENFLIDIKNRSEISFIKAKKIICEAEMGCFFQNSLKINNREISVTLIPNNKKQYIVRLSDQSPLVFIVDVNLSAQIEQILLTFKFTPTSTQPFITSISPTSGPIGTIVTIKGNNLNGFEGDMDAMIENSKSETAVLLGLDGIPSVFQANNQTIRVKIEDKICRKGNTYTGLPCESYLNIIPGVYNIYAYPWGKMSNKVQFTVLATSTQPPFTVLSPKGGDKLTIGGDYLIKWWDDQDAGNKNIYLVSPSTEVVVNIITTDNFMRSSGIDGTYSYLWKVSSSINPGNYRIKICKSDSGNCFVGNDYFTITN